MQVEEQEFIARCLICQQVKNSNTPPSELLQSLPIPDRIREDISLDFITGLPCFEGKTAILVVADHLSKYAHFVALSSHFTSSSIAAIFVQEIVRLLDLPRSIISDRDRVFISSFCRKLFRLKFQL